MTEEERDLLNHTHKMANEMHDALMKPNKLGEEPLIERIGGVVITIERGSWSVKWASRIVLTMGALAGAWLTIKTSMFK